VSNPEIRGVELGKAPPAFSSRSGLGIVGSRLCIVRGISARLCCSMRCEAVSAGRISFWDVRGKIDGNAYLTFFCVHSKSRCVSLAAFMPSAKFALVFANRALACACNAMSSRFFALSSPDLRAGVSAWGVACGRRVGRGKGHSHLRLSSQVLVQRDGVVRRRQTIVHVIE
jgi:hypothetical protein